MVRPIESFYLLIYLGSCYNSEILYRKSVVVVKTHFNETNNVLIKGSKEHSDMVYSNTKFKHRDSQLITHDMNVDRSNLGNEMASCNLFSSHDNYELELNKINLNEIIIQAQNVLNSTVENVRKSNITFAERAREDAYKKTDPAENPYSVLLVMKSGSKPVGLCSGSLLTDQWVLTAAHCLKKRKNRTVTMVEIYAGGNSYEEVKEGKPAPGSQILYSKEFFQYESFKSGRDGDVALVKADGNFNLTKTVNTVKLSPQPWTYHSYYSCKLTGFGMVKMGMESSDDSVRKTHTLEMKNPCLCSFRLNFLFGSQTTERFICSKPKEDYGMCVGDSGGGLICDGEVRGVGMQMVVMKNIATCELSVLVPMECGSANILNIFQNTCPFIRWINSYVKLYNDSDISPKCAITSRGSTRRPYGAGVLIFIWSTNNIISIM